MKFFVSLFTFRLPRYLVYMLQQVEYSPTKYREWLSHSLKVNKPIKHVMSRQTLVMTRRANMLLAAAYLFILITAAAEIAVFISLSGISQWLSLLILILLPIELIFFLDILALVAHTLIVQPQNSKLVARSKELFHGHSGTKIAVVGSYGKTTMKEILHTVLSQGKEVVATPGNKNVPVSHARFVQKLTGDEDVLVIEFGEGEPGDVAAMADTIAPDYAIITGIAPNHLDQYPNLDMLAKDILSVRSSVDHDKCLLNGDSPLLMKYAGDDNPRYSAESARGWEISDIEVGITNTSFRMVKGQNSMELSCALLGRHQVGPVACAAAIAAEIGLSTDAIIAGVANLQPYKHRMQPRNVSGAWLIDDTYNGNLEGLVAGLNLLKELDAKRTWYVTPGLVDQGVETNNVHTQLGQHIARTQPDIVVLMENSVRPIIERAMKDNGFEGELRVEQDPLAFYQGIEHQIAVGDVVLMQNDWTDNYN